jgi:hypothetical protein
MILTTPKVKKAKSGCCETNHVSNPVTMATIKAVANESNVGVGFLIIYTKLGETKQMEKQNIMKE